MRFHLLACLLLAAAARAAVSIDLDLARLRAVPDADAIRARIGQCLPDAMQAKLAALQALTGSDPRQDLQRILVEVPDAGPPTVRLIGLPATRIAAALALRGDQMAVCGGLTGYRLPQHPQMVFVALGERDALVGPAGTLAASAKPGALPPAGAQPVAIVVRPGANPRVPAMALVTELRITADGQGRITATATAKDEAAAGELERRYGALQAMVAAGANGGLPRMQQAGRILAGSTLKRHGTALEAAVQVPADIRQEAIDRILGRIRAHAGTRS